MYISESVKYIGVDDRSIDLFEGQYKVPNGMAYNSYAVIGEKTAIMDSVDAGFTAKWLNNIKEALGDKEPDYLIVQHMEPDHSGSIAAFAAAHPKATIVSSAKAFNMMKNYFGTDYSENRIVIAQGDSLDLGGRVLSFIAAPMVHWPEVIVTYDSKDKILFSADGFGKFGANDVSEDWACEARRYYFGIVGKFGAQVQALLKKAEGLDIEVICPLHGPVLNENLEYYINLYNIWSSYGVESEGVVIAYTSVYGNTKIAVEMLAEELRSGGCTRVVVDDLAGCDMSQAVEDAFRYGKIVLATTTYNGGIFPFMREFIEHLTERNLQNRTLAFIENGSWNPVAAKAMMAMFEKSKNITFAENSVKINSALTEENKTQLKALANELCG